MGGERGEGQKRRGGRRGRKEGEGSSLDRKDSHYRLLISTVSHLVDQLTSNG